MSSKRGRFILVALAAAMLAAQPAHALRVATWNLLAYDDAAVPNRRPYMIQVVPGLNPDVMIVQELLTASAADSFANLLKASMPARVWKYIQASQPALSARRCTTHWLPSRASITRVLWSMTTIVG